MSEEQAEYLVDALEMIGAGYSVEIEQPRTVIRRKGGRLEEFDRPAFVKISTDFKQELAGISSDALKVWIFLALSINRNSGRANPGLRTISKNVKMAVNTVQKALVELEALGLVAVHRGEKRYNLYEIPDYVSANRAEPSVSSRDTDLETVSNPDETVSNSAQTVSPSVILNQKNQKNQNTGGKPPVSLTPEEIEQATRKADAILGLAIPADPSKAWRGRDMMQPELLHYADWYNTTTGQVATKANRASWWKALRAWEDAGLEIKHLQEAYNARSKWRTVADPNELTKDAAAIKALGERPVEKIYEEGKSSGYYG